MVAIMPVPYLHRCDGASHAVAMAGRCDGQVTTYTPTAVMRCYEGRQNSVGAFGDDGEEEWHCGGRIVVIEVVEKECR